MSLSRKLAALTGKDDPLQAENDQLKADNAALTAKVEELTLASTGGAEELVAVTLAATEAAAEIEKITAENTALKADAATAKADGAKAKADAQAQIDTAENGIRDRAAKMAMDQMAAAGFDPGSLPKSNGSPPERRDDAPKHSGPRSEADAIRHAASHWSKN